MNRIHYLAYILIVCVASCWPSSLASGQTNFPGSILFHINQNAELSGTPSYTVRPTVFGIALPKVLTAPDGVTRFGTGPALPFQVTVPSFLELSQRFFGTWKLFEDSVNPMQADSNYAFTLSPFSLADVHSETPLVTSPTTGSTVPSVFDVSWQYPSGNTTAPKSITYSTGADVDFAPGNELRVSFSVDREVASDPFQFRAGSSSPLAAYMSPVTLLNGHPRSNYGIQASFHNYSLPVRVTVVPEPATAVLLGLGMMVLGWRR